MSTSLHLRRALLPLAFLSASTLASPPGNQAWDAPHAPFRILGNTWYVGTGGITVLLVRGESGAVLFDTGVASALPVVLANLETVDVDPREIKLILTSHAHHDHVGALSELQRRTGARVLVSAESARLLAAGGRGDLHFGDTIPYAPVTVDDTVLDGESVTLGELSFTAHLTPGHTPGSTTWTWTERSDGKDIAIVFADSLTAPGYRLLDHPKRPQLVDEFRASFEVLRTLPCDVLLTPHPQASDLFARTEKPQDDASGLIDPEGCRRYANRAERSLDEQIATQQAPAISLDN